MKPCSLGVALLRALLLFLLTLTPALRMAGADPDIAPLRAKAEKGNSVAQYYLGLVYAEGRAVPKDPVEAYIWLSLAAENGATGKALGILVTEMSPDQLAAARFRLNERRRTIPGVISVPRAGLSATPAEDRSDTPEQEAAIFRIDKDKLSDELAAAWKEADSAKAAAAAAEQRARQAEAGLSQRAKDLVALQTEREQLRQQLAAAPAASAVDALRQDRDIVASRLATANTDMQSLRQRMAQSEAENDRLQLAATGAAHVAASLATLQRERDEQAKSLAAVQTSATELTAQVKKLGEEKAALTQANGRLEEQALASARQAGDEASARAEPARRALEATVAAETQKVAAQTAELADTRKNLSVAEAGQAQAAGKLATARKELLSVQNANLELNAQVKKLTEDRESFSRQLAANGDATRELAVVRAKVESGGSDLDKLRSRNAELAAANQKLEEQARSAAQQAAARAAEAEEQRQALGAKVAERDGQLAAAQADQAQVAKLAAAFSAARKELAAAQSANAEVTVQLKKLTEEKTLLIQQAGRSGEASQEVMSLKTRLGQAESELNTVRTRNTELVAANQKLDEQIHSTALQTDETARTKAVLATAEQRARKAEATLGQRDKDLAVLQTDLQNTRRALKDFDAAQAAVAHAAATFEKNRQERDDLRQQLEAARKESAVTRSSGTELGAQIKKLAEENAALNRQLAERGDAAQRLAAVTAQLGETRKESAAAQSSGTELGAQIKKLAEENAALNRQLAERGDAAQRLAAVTAQLDDTRKELLTLKNHQAELNDSLRRLTEERGRLQTQAAAADTAKSEAARLQDQVATLTRQSDAARKDLAAAQTAAASQAGENTRQHAELQIQLQQARQELAELHTQNQSLNEASQRQSKGTAEAARQLAEAQTVIEHLKLENADLQAERTSLAARLAQAATAAAATTATTVASTGAGSREEVARLKEELARAEGKVEMTVRSFALAQQEIERLKVQIGQAGMSATQAHNAETVLTGAQQELAAVRADASKTAAETASLRDFLRQLQNANDSLAAENARLRTTVALAGGRLSAGSGAQPGRPVMVATSAVTPPAAPMASAPRTHRVVSGDTLTRISSRYYGTSTRWQDIYNANRDKLQSADALPLDAELKIP